MRKVMSFFIILEIIIIVCLVEIIIEEKQTVEPDILYQSDTYVYDDYVMSVVIENPNPDELISFYYCTVKMKYTYNNTTKYFTLFENDFSTKGINEYNVKWFDNYFSIYMANNRNFYRTYYFYYDDVLNNLNNSV